MSESTFLSCSYKICILANILNCDFNDENRIASYPFLSRTVPNCITNIKAKNYILLTQSRLILLQLKLIPAGRQFFG
jgi:hypothetical protein